MDDIILYHNPACGTSRNTLALIRAAGIEPVIIEYLKTPPSRQDIRALALASGQPLRALLREKDTPYAALGLSDPGLTDDQILDAIEARQQQKAAELMRSHLEGARHLKVFAVDVFSR